ncbi:MAG: DUF2267 domain-containing protein [Actinomycetota bacterium]
MSRSCRKEKKIDYETFLKSVGDGAGLEDKKSAEQATIATLTLLGSHMSPGQVENVSAQLPGPLKHGVVVLRGEVDDSRQASSLEEDVKNTPGVIDVDNLLHLPGEVPPNKRDAVEVTRRR